MAGLTLASPSAERRGYSPWRETWRRYRRHRPAVISAALLLLLIGMSVASWAIIAIKGLTLLARRSRLLFLDAKAAAAAAPAVAEILSQELGVAVPTDDFLQLAQRYLTLP